MKIPFLDLSRWQAEELTEIKIKLRNIVDKGNFILGEELKAFEEEFAFFTGKKYAVGTASGTDALTLSLLAAGIKPKDEVITGALTAYPTITGIERAGAVPVAVDIQKETGLIDPDCIRKAINNKTGFILPVHLWGNACDMERINDIAAEFNLKIIEDCAQAVGTSIEGNKAGSWSICAAYSFYPTKNLGALGDAGAVVTDEPEIYEKLKQLRNYGQEKKNRIIRPGLNSRMDEIQAALLRIKLKFLKTKLDRKKIISRKYDGINSKYLKIPKILKKSESGRHIFPVLVKDRERFCDYLNSEDIGFSIHYPLTVFEQPGFTGRVCGDCKHSVEYAHSEVSLPVFSELTDEEMERIVSVLKRWKE